MFMISPLFAFLSIIIIVLIYVGINAYHKDRQGLEAIFSNSLFQLNRNLQVYMQKAALRKKQTEWRPSAICVSEDSFERDGAFNLLNWLSYRYGFGTYIHLIKGYYSRKTHEQSVSELTLLAKRFSDEKNHVFIDTMISPSYTSAIAQSIQLPGVSGMENNMVILEFDKGNPTNLEAIIENFGLVRSGKFDVWILAGSSRVVEPKKGIHIWIRSIDTENSNLMILLGYIIMGHPDWSKAPIHIFDVCKPGHEDEAMKQFNHLIENGRLQITTKNIEIITQPEGVTIKSLINERSAEAALTFIGFHEGMLKYYGADLFKGYDALGSILFVNSHQQIEIS